MKQAITKCEWCLTENSNESTQCIKCGGPVLVLEPWVLQCGWCNSSNRRDLMANCKSCGGELPHIPGIARQPEPPMAPRKLTSTYKNWVRFRGNTLMIIGIGFTVVGIPVFLSFFIVGLFIKWYVVLISLVALIFPVIGIASIINSNKKATQKLYALQYGLPTKGVINNVFIDTTQAINKKHPVNLQYTFSDGKKEFVDKITVWDHANLQRPKGEHIWVVYNPTALEQNNVWPPLR